MIILLSLVCALQACLTLWLYRKVIKLVSKVSDMQAGILIANLGSGEHVERHEHEIIELGDRVTDLKAAKEMKNIQARMVYTITQEERDVLKSADKMWKVAQQWVAAKANAATRGGSEQEDPSFDEQYQDPDPPDDRDPGSEFIQCQNCDNEDFANYPEERAKWKLDHINPATCWFCDKNIDPHWDRGDPCTEMDPYDGSPADTH